MPDQAYLLEISRDEAEALEGIVERNPDDERLDALRETSLTQPFAGLVIRAPASAIDHIEVVVGSLKQMPLNIAIVADDMSSRRIPTIERDLSYVTRAIMAIRRRDALRDLIAGLDAARATLLTEAEAAESDVDTARAALDDLASLVLSVSSRLPALVP